MKRFEVIEEVWQYGSNEDKDPLWEQDGVAPQCPVQGLTMDQTNPKYGRINIPNDWDNRDFIGAHLIENYTWIFKRITNPKSSGYVKKRN